MSKTFREVISLWPSIEAMAEDVGAKEPAVRKWQQRDRIPADYWFSVAGAANRRGETISVEKLAEIAARTR
jgi:hypothetical protein